MKTNKLKLFALVATLMASSFAFAQEQQEAKQWSVGDTIVVKKTTQQYLTGERPAKFVYFVEHIIMQVGTTRFPDGVLLRGICSWVGSNDIMLKDAAKEECALRAEEITHLTDAEKAQLNSYANKIGAHVIEQSPATPEPEPVVEEPVSAPEPVVEEPAPVSEPMPEITPVVEAEPQVEPQAEPQVEPQKFTHLDKMHRFSIGVRGGVASLMHEADVMGKWNAGFDALLDLQYAYYFGGEKNKKVNPGILTGVSIGWAQSALKSGIDTAYTVSTVDGNIDYTITAENVKENDGQLQVEIPIMFTMIAEKGFFLNVGPKVIIPVFSHYNQNITNPDINAYFPTEGVNVSNEVITGLVQDNQLKTNGKWNTSKVNVMLTAELGWEWILKNEHSIGLGVYGNYSVYDLYNNTTHNKSLINVTAPSAGPAIVDVLSATDTYAKGMGYFDCGLKLVYHFNFRNK